jgi:hypothetical protein
LLTFSHSTSFSANTIKKIANCSIFPSTATINSLQKVAICWV